MNRRSILGVLLALLVLALVLFQALPRTQEEPTGTGGDAVTVVDGITPAQGGGDASQKASEPAASPAALESNMVAASGAPEDEDESIRESVDVDVLNAEPVEELKPSFFEMGEETAYEPQVALVEISEGASADEVLRGLSQVSDVPVEQYGAEEFLPGYLRITLPEGKSVEEAVNELYSLDAVKIAQPNYYVYVCADGVGMESEGDGSASGPRRTVSATSASDAFEADDSTVGEPEKKPLDEPEEMGLSDSKGAEQKDGDAASHDEGNTYEELGTEGRQGTSSVGKEDASGFEGMGDDTSTELAHPQEEAKSAEGETSVAVAGTPTNDPFCSEQWALDSIEAPGAWTIAKTNRSVTVATLDNGCDISHPDLKANIVAPYNSYNALFGGSTSDVTPATEGYKWHGTHVAGIISAISDNGVGVSGVSYNARVMPIKVVGPTGTGTTDSLAKAYEYILDNASRYNVRVVNISMGYPREIRKDELLLKKIDEAYSKGIVTVAAAGNESTKDGMKAPFRFYPGDYETVVSVIGLQHTESGDTRYDGSNYNVSGEKTKNISAPGASIYSTAPGNKYESHTGTSMAAPHVSSVLALEFAAKPSLSAAEAVRILYATATDIGNRGWDSFHGWGEVNARYAVHGAKYGVEEAKLARVRAEEQEKRNTEAANSISYTTHVQDVGWQAYVKNGTMAGTSGRSLRLEGIKIKLSDAPYSGSVEYRTHIQNIGWQAWKSSDQMSGTSGRSLRLEAIQIRLTGEMANHYDVWYHVHAQNIGWMGWTKNGEAAGTAGYAYRLEGIQILIKPKGSAAPGKTSGAFTFPISYQTHVQNVGWQGLVMNGAMSGTSGRSLRLEGIIINMAGLPFSGTVQYKTHIQNLGWEGSWRSSGQMSGTSGRSLRLEGIQIRLTDELSNRYDVWYRTHVQNYGWTGWAKNGAPSGSSGHSYRLEGIEIRLTAKNGAAPGSTANAFYS